MSAPVQQLMFMDPGAAALFLIRAEAARGSALDSTHISAYTDLINGLISDNIWSNAFDILRIYATQDSATALLNLISPSFTASANGSPTFTADRGYTGVNASSTVYINTGFNPSTAGGLYTQNSAHISAWSLTNAASGTTGGAVVGLETGNTRQTNIIPKYNDGNGYFRINSDTADSGLSVANSDSRGHYISNRSASNANQAYRNGSSILTGSGNSTAVVNANFFDLAESSSIIGATFGGGYQIAATSIGRSLSSTEASNFYNRLRTYMTAVGVP